MTRYILLLVALVMTTSSFAKRTSAPRSLVAKRYSFSSYTHSTKRSVKNACIQKIQEMVTTAESELNILYEKGYEYECSEMIIQSKTKINSHYTMARGPFDFIHDYSASVVVKCVPRKLSEKAIYSMAKRCELNPVEACFEDSILEKIDKVGTTFITYKHSGKSCKLME